jgi:hypothetical protein
MVCVVKVVKNPCLSIVCTKKMAAAAAIAACFSAVASTVQLVVTVHSFNVTRVKELTKEKKELLYGKAREDAINIMTKHLYPGEKVKGYYRRWESLLEEQRNYNRSWRSKLGPHFEFNLNEKGVDFELWSNYIRMKQIQAAQPDPIIGSTIGVGKEYSPETERKNLFVSSIYFWSEELKKDAKEKLRTKD